MHISHTSETCNICLSLSALFHYIFSKLIHVTNAESLFLRLNHILPYYISYFKTTYKVAVFKILWCVCVCLLLSHVQLFATPWTVAHQTPLSIDFSRQEYWSGHILLQGIFQTQGLNPGLLHCRWIIYWLSHQGSLNTMVLACK